MYMSIKMQHDKICFATSPNSKTDVLYLFFLLHHNIVSWWYQLGCTIVRTLGEK